MDLDKTVEEIPLKSIDGDAVEYVMQYVLHHKAQDVKMIEKPLKSKFMRDNVQVNQKELFMQKKKNRYFFCKGSMGR